MPDENEKNSNNAPENENENENRGRKKAASSFDGVTFLLWAVIAGFIIMLIASVIDKLLGMAVCGIVILIGGIAAFALKIKITRKTFVVALLPLIGIAVTTLAMYMWLTENFPATFPPASKETQKMFWGALGLISGVLIASLTILFRVNLKKRCTLEVEAVCKGLEEFHSRGYRFYTPVWEYYVDGNIYTHSEKVSSLKRAPEAGFKQKIMINPDDPSEIYRRESKGYILLVITGVCLIFAGIMVLGVI